MLYDGQHKMESANSTQTQHIVTPDIEQDLAGIGAHLAPLFLYAPEASAGAAERLSATLNAPDIMRFLEASHQNQQTSAPWSHLQVCK